MGAAIPIATAIGSLAGGVAAVKTAFTKPKIPKAPQIGVDQSIQPKEPTKTSNLQEGLAKEADLAAEEARKKNAQRRGRSSTILTGGLGNSGTRSIGTTAILGG